MELLRALGLRPAMCHLAAMAILATRATWRQAVSAENDVAVAALFFATLLYALRYARGGKRADLVLAAVAFGLLCGIKYYALGYAAVAGLGTALSVAAYRGPRAAGGAFAASLAGALLLGGYWYARNAVASGTPLYPKGFTPETDVWGQIRPDTPTSTLLGSGRPVVWPLLAEAIAVMAGPCHLVAALLLPAVLVWLFVASYLGRSRSDQGASLYAWLALLAVLSLLVFINMPNVVETVPGSMNMLRWKYHPVRFGLCPLSLAVIGLAVVSSDVMNSFSSSSPPANERSATQTLLQKNVSRALAAGLVVVSRLIIVGLWVSGLVYQVV
ncbi:MAG: hypothetical protein H5T92_11155, partial [Synergistales bacterium]|nr:hypothetical protein [Synergistales bacterium]